MTMREVMYGEYVDVQVRGEQGVNAPVWVQPPHVGVVLHEGLVGRKEDQPVELHGG